MLLRSAGTVLVALMACGFLNGTVQAQARDGLASTAHAEIDELKSTFTLSGKPIPPLVFRDLGDGDLADATSALDSVDVAAAVHSNLYANPVKAASGWMTQDGSNGVEAGYRFVGVTDSGLVAIVTRFNSGGSGTFYSLHILDLQAGGAYDADGRRFDRIDLKAVRAIPLGDRWSGEVIIKGNRLVIRADRSREEPARSATREITAERP